MRLDFVKDEEEVLTFSADLSSLQRKYVHQQARFMKLKSKSMEDVEYGKRVIIIKPKFFQAQKEKIKKASKISSPNFEE